MWDPLHLRTLKAPLPVTGIAFGFPNGFPSEKLGHFNSALKIKTKLAEPSDI
jgi:hypothetical protein